MSAVIGQGRLGFGTFMLDIERGALRHAGRDIPLRPKSFAVLRYLLERPGRLVSRDELLNAVWGQAVVTDDSLTQCLIEIRRALGDTQQQIVRTLPRRGYRFDPPPTGLRDVESARLPSARRTYAALAVLVLAGLVLLGLSIAPIIDPAPPGQGSRIVPDEASIAVLPFVDLSAARDQGYLADGLAEEILNRLARTDGLRVIARTSSFSYRDRGLDVRSIADRLHVSHVLEGSVRTSGNRLRITTQLIATQDSRHLWSHTYDRTVDDVFAIEDEIAGAVADALELTLETVGPGVRLQSALAQEKYLQGRFFYNRRAPQDLERALDYYRQALAIDPDDARTWAALAAVYGRLGETGGGSLARMNQRDAALRAVALDPALAEAQMRLADYYFGIGDRDGGRAHAQKARALDPDSTLALTSAAYEAVCMGDYDTAIELHRRAVALDPLAAVGHANFALLLLGGDRIEESKSEFTTAQALNPDLELPEATFLLVLEHRYDEAMVGIERLTDAESRDLGLVMLYHTLGRTADAQIVLERLAASARGSSLRLAEAYAFHGAHDQAFQALDAFRRRDSGRTLTERWTWRTDARISWFLRPLRADPRWQSVLADTPADSRQGTGADGIALAAARDLRY